MRYNLWAFIVPAIGINVALAFFVDDPFGDDLATYGQLASTILLVAVTVSYVVATHGIAKASEAQLTLMRRERGMAAVGELWEAYCHLGEASARVIRDLRVSANEAVDDTNAWAVHQDPAFQSRQALSGFVALVRRLSPYLSDDVDRAARELADTYRDIARQAEVLSGFVYEEVTAALNDQRPKSLDALRSRWAGLAELGDGQSGLPVWEHLGSIDQQAQLERLEGIFEETVQRTLREHTSGSNS